MSVEYLNMSLILAAVSGLLKTGLMLVGGETKTTSWGSAKIVLR